MYMSILYIYTCASVRVEVHRNRDRKAKQSKEKNENGTVPEAAEIFERDQDSGGRYRDHLRIPCNGQREMVR